MKKCCLCDAHKDLRREAGYILNLNADYKKKTVDMHLCFDHFLKIKNRIIKVLDSEWGVELDKRH